METGIFSTILLILNALVTYQGFRSPAYFEKYEFNVDRILIAKEYHRLVTSGFLHVNWTHFVFNMIALVSFGDEMEKLFGFRNFLLLYFLSMVGGSLLALYIHRNHGDYTAVGASGALSGVIFASVIICPDCSLGFVLLPDVHIKNWIFAAIFVLISILGIKSQKDNIGHEAHLGGAIIGVIFTLIIYPMFFQTNWWIVLLILIPSISFLILIVQNPSILFIEGYWGETVKNTQSTFKKS